MKIIVLLLLTALLWGATPILEKIGLRKADPIMGVTIRSIAVTVFLFVYLLFVGRVREIFATDLKTIAIFVVTGLMAGLLGMITYFAALRMGATSEVVPIVASYPLITAILSVIVLGEHVSLWRIIGTVLIVSGVWLVQLK